jgi:hypothetical protein
LVRAAPDREGRDSVPFGDLILDRVLEVGEGGEEHVYEPEIILAVQRGVAEVRYEVVGEEIAYRL